MKYFVLLIGLLIAAAVPAQVVPVSPPGTMLGNGTGSTAVPTALPTLTYLCVNNATTDTTAINNLLSSGTYNVRLLEGTCSINNTITVPQGQYILGAGNDSTVLNFTGTGYSNAIVFSPPGSGRTRGGGLKGLTINTSNITSGSQTTGYSVTSSGRALQVFEDLVFNSPYNGFYFTNFGTPYLERIWGGSATGSYGFYLDGSTGVLSSVININDIAWGGKTVSGGGNCGSGGNSSCYIGMVIDGEVNSINGHNWAFTNSYRGIWMTNSTSQSIIPAFLVVENVQADFPIAEGYRFDVGQWVQMTYAYSQHSYTADQLYIASGFDHVNIVGQELTGAALRSMNIGGSNVIIQGAHGYGNCTGGGQPSTPKGSYPAVEIQGTAQNVQIQGGIYEASASCYQNYSFLIDSGATGVTINGADVSNTFSGISNVVSDFFDASGINNNLTYTGNTGSNYAISQGIMHTNVAGWGAQVTYTASGGSVATGSGACTVVAGGHGFTTAPTVTMVSGGGTGATMTVTIVNGAISTCNVTAGGSGFTNGTWIATVAYPSSALGQIIEPYFVTAATQSMEMKAQGGGSWRLGNDVGGVAVLGTTTAIEWQTGQADQSKTVTSHSTGFSQTVGSSSQTTILTATGTLATGTVTMPASPVDGQMEYFSCSQTITALTVSPNSGQTINGAPSTCGPTAPFSFIYDSGTTTWYRRN